MKIENKRQWVGELFFLLGTILYITYYFFLYSLLLVCRERSDKTNSSAKTILYWINLFCGQNNINKISMERSNYWSSRSCFDVFMLEKLWRN